jgi:(2Fe-2S) ferredoxin
MKHNVINNSQDYQRSEFSLEGQFLGFIMERGKFKHLRIAVAEDELQIKLSKQARASLFRSLAKSPSLALRPSDSIQISGEKKLDQQTGQLKLKAHEVKKKDVACSPVCEASDPLCSLPHPSVEVLSAKAKAKTKILVCQKSGCLKKGGKRLLQELEVALRDRGLQDQVVIRQTGCLKHCSSAPNVVLTPCNKRVSGMKPNAIAALLEKLSLK